MNWRALLQRKLEFRRLRFRQAIKASLLQKPISSHLRFTSPTSREHPIGKLSCRPTKNTRKWNPICSIKGKARACCWHRLLGGHKHESRELGTREYLYRGLPWWKSAFRCSKNGHIIMGNSRDGGQFQFWTALFWVQFLRLNLHQLCTELQNLTDVEVAR